MNKSHNPMRVLAGVFFLIGFIVSQIGAVGYYLSIPDTTVLSSRIIRNALNDVTWLHYVKIHLLQPQPLLFDVLTGMLPPLVIGYSIFRSNHNGLRRNLFCNRISVVFVAFQSLLALYGAALVYGFVGKYIIDKNELKGEFLSSCQICYIAWVFYGVSTWLLFVEQRRMSRLRH